MPVYPGRCIAVLNAVRNALRLYYNGRHPLTPKDLADSGEPVYKKQEEP